MLSSKMKLAFVVTKKIKKSKKPKKYERSCE